MYHSRLDGLYRRTELDGISDLVDALKTPAYNGMHTKKELNMPTWNERKAVGDAHEHRVSHELEQRGWTVAEWGKGTMPPEINEAMRASGSPWNHFPDLVASRDGDIITVDSKDRMSSVDTGRYAVKRECVAFGLRFYGSFGIPLFYVFGNLGVLTPQEVSSYGIVGPRVRGGAYFLVNGSMAHLFDDVFGTPRQQRGEAAA